MDLRNKVLIHPEDKVKILSLLATGKAGNTIPFHEVLGVDIVGYDYMPRGKAVLIYGGRIVAVIELEESDVVVDTNCEACLDPD